MTTTKRKRSVSPTQHALAELRKSGFDCWIVESVIPKTWIKRDFMGWADIIYLTGKSIVGIQVTSGTNHATRDRSVTDLETDLSDAIRLIIGLKTNIPWYEVSFKEVQAYLDTIQQLKKGMLVVNLTDPLDDDAARVVLGGTP